MSAEIYSLKHKIKYMQTWLNWFKKELKKVQEEYKDDPVGLSMFSQGYKEHIEQLKKEIKEAKGLIKDSPIF